ncbi:hypothetical protein THAOC_25810, partial [Thalassiosira oceanica]
MVGWLVDTVGGTIELPPHRVRRLHEMLRAFPRSRRTCRKKDLHKLVGELRSMIIAIPGGVGCLSWLQERLKSAPDRIYLNNQFKDAIDDFKWLANDITSRPTRIGEIVPEVPVYVGCSDASGLGAGGVWLPDALNLYTASLSSKFVPGQGDSRGREVGLAMETLANRRESCASPTTAAATPDGGMTATRQHLASATVPSSPSCDPPHLVCPEGKEDGLRSWEISPGGRLSDSPGASHSSPITSPVNKPITSPVDDLLTSPEVTGHPLQSSPDLRMDLHVSSEVALADDPLPSSETGCPSGTATVTSRTAAPALGRGPTVALHPGMAAGIPGKLETVDHPLPSLGTSSASSGRRRSNNPITSPVDRVTSVTATATSRRTEAPAQSRGPAVASRPGTDATLPGSAAGQSRDECRTETSPTGRGPAVASPCPRGPVSLLHPLQSTCLGGTLPADRPEGVGGIPPADRPGAHPMQRSCMDKYLDKTLQVSSKVALADDSLASPAPRRRSDLSTAAVRQVLDHPLPAKGTSIVS